MKQVIAWLRLKHTSITQAIGVVIASGVILGWWSFSKEEIAAILMLPGALWLLIGANTVTSNLRLTGKAFDSPSGVDVDKVAQHALGGLGPVPAEFQVPAPVDLSDVVEGAGLA